MIIDFLIEILVLLLPCFSTSLVFFPTYPSFNLIRFTLCSLVFFYFIIVLRQILQSANESQKLAHELDSAMLPWVGVIVVSWILLFLFITIPNLQMNQYIVNPLVMVSFQFVASMILYISKAPKYQEASTTKGAPSHTKAASSVSQSPAGMPSSPSSRHHHSHHSSQGVSNLQNQGSRRLLIPEEEHSIDVSVSNSNFNDEQSRLDESKRETSRLSNREVSISHDKTPLTPSHNNATNLSIHLNLQPATQTTTTQTQQQRVPLALIPAADPELEDDHEEHGVSIPLKESHDKDLNEDLVWVE